MSRLSPIGVALFLAFIGIVFGRVGLFFPLALAAAVALAIVQKRSGEPR